MEHSPELHILHWAVEQDRAPPEQPAAGVIVPRAAVAEVTEMVSEKENLPFVAPSLPGSTAVGV